MISLAAARSHCLPCWDDGVRFGRLFSSCQTLGTENIGARSAPYRRQLRACIVKFVFQLNQCAVHCLHQPSRHRALRAMRFSLSRNMLVYVLAERHLHYPRGVSCSSG